LIYIVIGFEIVINMNVGYYDLGCEVTDRVKIFKNYIKSSFLADIIFIISLIMINNDQNISGLLFLIKIKNIKKLIQNLED